MLLKKKKFVVLLSLTVLLGITLVACTSDDSTPPIVDDTGGGDDGDDGPPVGFQGEIDWIRSLGGSGIDEAVGIVKTNDNAYVVVGTTASNDGDIVDKTTTDSDFWILKLSETGAIVWNKTYGGSNDDVATDIASTSDGGYIISGYSRSNDGDVTGNEGFHDYWILKINANGNKQWNKTFGFLGSDQAFEILQTKEGGYLVSGFFDVTASGGAGNDGRSGGNRHGVGEYWVLKLNASGEYVWRRYFGGTNNDRSYDALETDDGGYLIMGSSESSDFDITDSKGSYDYWVVKLNAGGDKLWTKSYGGSEIENGYAAANAGNGEFMLVGDSRSEDQDITNPKGNADLWVVKINANGGKIWQKSFGGAQFDSARSIERLPNGNFLIAGATRSSSGDVSVNNGENDAWMIIMNANGGLVFEKSIGGSNFDFAESAIQGHENDTYIMVGNTESNDKDIPQNRGIKDLLVVKIK